MSDELRGVLFEAASEIKNLRRSNELLAAKVEVLDLLGCLLYTRPAGQSGGMAPDVVWAIEKQLKALEPKTGERTEANA